MYNGYEIWKSDAEKCARYRITNAAGGMCGRCMKTCPWNLEGLLADSLWRQVAMKLPGCRALAGRLDDQLDRGSINPVKTWWWDIELDRATGGYVQRGADQPARPAERPGAASTKTRAWPSTRPTRCRRLTRWPFPVNREEGIERYRALLTPGAVPARLAAGQTDGLAPPVRRRAGEPPVFPVQLVRREEMAAGRGASTSSPRSMASALPPFEAGAHIDVVIAPEYQRHYSLAGDPADRSNYVLGVLREAPAAQGGRARRLGADAPRLPRRPQGLHHPAGQPLSAARRRPATALLFAGGIGVTPLIAMAHRLHALGTAVRVALQRGQPRAAPAF